MIINFKVQCQKIQWSNPTRAPVEGSVGEVYAQFFVDSEWEGRTIFAVFSNEEGNAPLPEPVLWTGDPIKVPASVLVDGVLRVGLVGVKDGNTLTTQYMARGVLVHRSGGTGGEAVDPDPALWEQVLITIGNLAELDTTDKSSLVAAINEANRTKVNSEDIKAAVDDYLEKNPIAAADIMTGATAGTAGKSGLVPAPAAGDEGKVLHGDGTWKTPEAGGAKSWNDLLDRPFYETITEGTEILPETTITFADGSATIPNSAYSGEFVDGQRYMIEIDGEGHTATAMYEGSPVYDYYFDTDDGLYSFAGKFDINGSHEDGDATIRIYEVAVEIKTLDSKFLTMDEEVLANSNNPVPGKVLYDALGGKLDKKYDTASAGRLLAIGSTGYVALREAGMVGATASETGSSGFVPAPAAGDQDKVLHGDGTWKTPETGGDYIPVPETAEVGQTIRVSAVDENGKPTAWEAVDMASGGGEKPWRLLVNYESTEEVAANQGMVFDKDDAGNLFECKEILIDWFCPAAPTSSYATFKINGKQANGGTQAGSWYFWSGALFTTADKRNTFRIEALTDACFLRLEQSDSAPNEAPVWYTYEGAFDAIRSLQLTMFGSTYPVGHKFKIWGR